MNFSDINTVSDAVEFYNSNTDEKEKLLATIKSAIDENAPVDSKDELNSGTLIQNHNYANALMLTQVMFERTTKELRILCGSDVIKFLHILKGSFVEACKKIITNNGFVKIISVLTENKSNASDFTSFINEIHEISDLRDLNIETISAYLAPGKEINHFIVSDDQNLRLEEPHPIIREDSGADSIKADVYFNNIKRASVAIRRFDDLFTYLKNNG
jgi:hypothetical protein